MVTFIRKELSFGFDKELRDEDDLIASGVLDSLNLLRLVKFVEDTFKAGVGDGDIGPRGFRALRAIAAFIARRRSA